MADWYELTFICSSCQSETRVLLEGVPILCCRRCGAPAKGIGLGRFCGFVYVLSNPLIPGLVKIGSTERSVTERAAELSAATGVPAPYEVEASFCSNAPREDELKVHEALGDTRIPNREFFNIEVAATTAKVAQILQRAPFFVRNSVPKGPPMESGVPPEVEQPPLPTGMARVTCSACRRSWVLKPRVARRMNGCPICGDYHLVHAGA